MVKCGKVNKINVNNSADYSSSSFINYSKIPQTKTSLLRRNMTYLIDLAGEEEEIR